MKNSLRFFFFLFTAAVRKLQKGGFDVLSTEARAASATSRGLSSLYWLAGPPGFEPG